MTDMIDKIARAMHANVNGHVIPPPTWDNQSEQSQNYWRIGARAAIVTMRKPTQEMIDLCVDLGHDRDDAVDAWEDMIDSALGVK